MEHITLLNDDFGEDSNGRKPVICSTCTEDNPLEEWGPWLCKTMGPDQNPCPPSPPGTCPA